MFDMFGRKKANGLSDDFDEEKAREAEIQEEKDTAVIYIADSVGSFSRGLGEQIDAAHSALEELVKVVSCLNTENDEFGDEADFDFSFDTDLDLEIKPDFEGINQRLDNIIEKSSALESIRSDTFDGARRVSEKLDEIATDTVSGGEEPDFDAVKKELEELRETNKKITETLTEIREVASKADVLALTATIEASKLGEAGLGIAHVAGDVRGIASGIREAVQRVDELGEEADKRKEKIESMLDDAKEAASKSSEAREIAAKEITSKLGEAKEVLDDITKPSERISDTFKEIKEMVLETERDLETKRQDIERDVEQSARKISSLEQNAKERLENFSLRISGSRKKLKDIKSIENKLGAALDKNRESGSTIEHIDNLISQVRPIIEGE